MKKTINITINGLVFNIEEDAYNRLRDYLEALKSHFGSAEYGTEVVNDIESRIAEQFNSKLRDRKKEVVSSAEIDEVIKNMGSIEDLTGGTRQESDKSQEAQRGRKRLFRNSDDQIVAGVGSGIASYFNIDPIIPRVLFVVSALAGGYGVLLYIILWIIIPEAKTSAEKLEMKGDAVTVANLEESRKEAAGKKENFNFVRYFFREVIYIIGRIIRALGPIFRSVIGLFLTALSFVSAFALILLTTVLLVNPNSPYIDPAVAQVFNGTQYILLVSSAFVAIIIPVLIALLLGIGLVRKRNLFTTPITIVFAVLWIAGATTFGAMASSAAPQIQAAVKRVESQPDHSKEFSVGSFNSVRAQEDQKIKLVYGRAPKVVAYGTEDQVNNLRVEVNNGMLNVERNDQNFHICIICIERQLTLEVTTNDLAAVEAQHASEVTIQGFPEFGSLSLTATGASQVAYEGSSKNLTLDIRHAARMTLSGKTDTMNVETSGASQLFAKSMQSGSVTIKAEHSSSAEVYAAQSIDAEAEGASRIDYYGNPAQKTVDESEAARIQQK